MIRQREVLYENLQSLLVIMDRILPSPETLGDPDELLGSSGIHTPLAQFSPSQNAVVEAKPEGAWRLNIDARNWRMDQDIPPRYTNTGGKRWYARRITQHGSALEDQVTNTGRLAVPPPSGVRLWHCSEEARRLLLLAKHDLNALFQSQTEEPTLPHDNDMGTCGGMLSLLVTPMRVLGFRDGVSLIKEHSPYLTRLCLEYAFTICWLYGLSIDEMASLTKMRITRHVEGTPITLHEDGGGFYDSGPLLTAMVGCQHILHDFSPSLMGHVRPTEQALTPVRLRVPEGVLLVIDGYARSSYGHGYTREAHQGGCYYTIDFIMDSMRATKLIGYVKETGGMVMHTPVVHKHVVQTKVLPTEPQENTHSPLLYGTCPLLDLVRKMHSRFQNVESLLLASHRRAIQTSPPLDSETHQLSA